MQIPEQGKTREEISEFLNITKNFDAKWDDGRMYAYVYDPGKDVMEVGKQAYFSYLVENGLDPITFPSVLKLETDVVRAIITLLRGDAAVVGNLTTGGTESILLAMKTARDWARMHRPEIQAPEIVLCQTAHHAFHKAAQYFGLNVVITPFDPVTFRADVAAMSAAITPNTILLVGSAPAYSQGVVDPIPEIAALALQHGLLCHVDACVGGIHLAFMRKLGQTVPEYDWSVPGVTSISTDLHKFGYCPKQCSLVMYRNRDLRRFQIFTSTRTTCYSLVNTTILSTKTGGPVAAAWAVLNYLGENGYKQIVAAVQDAVARMIEGVNRIPGLSVMGKPDLCMFAFCSDTLNIFQIGHAMSTRGWYVQPQFGRPAAPANLHVSVHYGTVERVDEFLAALRESVDEVQGLPPLDHAALKLQIESLIAENPADLFQKVSAMAGLEDTSPAGGRSGSQPEGRSSSPTGGRSGSLPQSKAMLSTLLSAMPEEMQSSFLVEYYNHLYS